MVIKSNEQAQSEPTPASPRLFTCSFPLAEDNQKWELSGSRSLSSSEEHGATHLLLLAVVFGDRTRRQGACAGFTPGLCLTQKLFVCWRCWLLGELELPPKLWALRYLHQQIQSQQTQTLNLTHLLAEDKAGALPFTAAHSSLLPAGLLWSHSSSCRRWLAVRRVLVLGPGVAHRESQRLGAWARTGTHRYEILQARFEALDGNSMEKEAATLLLLCLCRR